MNIKRAEFSEAEKAEILSAQKGTYPTHVYKRLFTLKLKAVDESKRQTPLLTLHSAGALIGSNLATWSSARISRLRASCISQVR